MSIDVQLFHILNSLAGRSASIDAVIVFFASYLPYLLIILLVILILLSSSPKRGKLRTFIIVAAASAVSFGIVQLVRVFYHRPRPFLVLPTHGLLTDPAWSFPSAHATVFFAIATSIYLYHRKWGIFFFIAAALIALARVAAGIHYPSDIVAGALLGVLVAYATFSICRKWP